MVVGGFYLVVARFSPTGPTPQQQSRLESEPPRVSEYPQVGMNGPDFGTKAYLLTGYPWSWLVRKCIPTYPLSLVLFHRSKNSRKNNILKLDLISFSAL